MRIAFATRAGIAAVWLLFMAWVFRYEARPDLFTRTVDGYRGLLGRDVPVMDSWMIVRFQGEPIGYSHTLLEVNDANPLEYHLFRNSVHLRFSALGTEQTVNTEVEASLNMLYELQKFEFRLSSPGYSLSVRGRRVDERRFQTHWRTDHTRRTASIEIPPDAVIYSPMTAMALKRLRPGQTLSLKTLDPTTLGTATATLRALRTETLELAGVSHEALVVATEYLGMRTLSWIALTDGGTLRQETPFGWTMEAATVDEAFAALRAAGSATTDMLTRLAVPVRGHIADPRGSRALRLRLVGVPFEPAALASHRQHVERVEGNETVLRVEAERLPTPSLRQAGLPAPSEAADDIRRPDAELEADAIAPFLAPSQGVESDHPDMMAQARKITEGHADPLARARAIFDWVHRNLEKEMTVSMPSALDVLRTRKGDCNEHTYLFVALARAAGLPARILVGLAYHEGAFYYHAWPSVHVGRWLEMDPTWGQEAVDATHIAVVEGDLSQQVEIVRMVGRLTIEILEEERL